MSAYRLTFEVLCQLKAKECLLLGSPELRFCQERAEFSHREACEFMFFIGYDEEGWADFKEEMADAGCSEAFMDDFEDARGGGAQRLLLFV